MIRMPATPKAFDRKAWISRFGAALEETLAGADHMRVPFGIYGTMRIDDRRRETHRRYLEMATLANTDAYAAKLFDESSLWLDALPDGVLDLLREHPAIAQAWSAGPGNGFRLGAVFGRGTDDAKFLISYLAKLSARVGGAYAATLLHRFLVAGNGVRLHAHEITVLHGLKVDERIALGRGAYLTSYDAIRERFALPEDPEPWLRERAERPDRHPGRLLRPSSLTALVRRFNWGPGAAPRHDSGERDRSIQHRYWFPADHCVDSITDVFEEADILLHLLSIAVRSMLVSHASITAVPRWMKQLNPNFRNERTGHIGAFDLWPEDREPSVPELRAFAAAGRGWVAFCAGKGDRSTELAIRRTAASVGIAGGRLGAEDRIIDASVALEALYGPFDSGEVTRKINQRAAWLLGGSDAERRTISKEMKSFYRTRSKIVHGTVSKEQRRREKEVGDALASGRELARRSLFAVLNHGPINNEAEWDALVSGRSGRRGRVASQLRQVVQHLVPKFLRMRR